VAPPLEKNGLDQKGGVHGLEVGFTGKRPLGGQSSAEKSIERKQRSRRQYRRLDHKKVEHGSWLSQGLAPPSEKKKGGPSQGGRKG